MQEIKKWSFLSGINFKDSFISSVFILLKHCMNMKKNHYPVFWPSILYASLPVLVLTLAALFGKSPPLFPRSIMKPALAVVLFSVRYTAMLFHTYFNYLVI